MAACKPAHGRRTDCCARRQCRRSRFEEPEDPAHPAEALAPEPVAAAAEVGMLRFPWALNPQGGPVLPARKQWHPDSMVTIPVSHLRNSCGPMPSCAKLVWYLERQLGCMYPSNAWRKRAV